MHHIETHIARGIEQTDPLPPGVAVAVRLLPETRSLSLAERAVLGFAIGAALWHVSKATAALRAKKWGEPATFPWRGNHP